MYYPRSLQTIRYNLRLQMFLDKNDMWWGFVICIAPLLNWIGPSLRSVMSRSVSSAQYRSTIKLRGRRCPVRQDAEENSCLLSCYISSLYTQFTDLQSNICNSNHWYSLKRKDGTETCHHNSSCPTMDCSRSSVHQVQEQANTWHHCTFSKIWYSCNHLQCSTKL